MGKDLTLNSSAWLGCALAIFSAVAWGCGDFTGGLATKKSLSNYAILAISSLAGTLLLSGLTLFSQETAASGESLMWAFLAGVSGTAGLGFLYFGLSKDSAAIIAPTSAVVSASLPVVYHWLVQKSPPLFLQELGIFLAIVGIYLLTPGSGQKSEGISINRFVPKSIYIGLASGVGFGGFYIFLSLIEPGKIFFPLVVARGTAFIFSALLFLMSPNKTLPRGIPLGLAFFAGILDGLGNLLFLLAKNLLRLDFAVVLSSIYPAITVILASLVLRQKVSFQQKVAIFLCLLGIAMIVA